MAKILTIAGTPYNFPESGASPNWASDVVDWAEAITNEVGGFNTLGDILTTSFALNNNITSASNIIGFTFDISSVRSFESAYSIYRVTKTSGAVISEELAESGILSGTYSSGAASWELTQTGNNLQGTGVELSITAAGQVKYISSNLTIPSGGTHSAKIVFRAQVTTQ